MANNNITLGLDLDTTRFRSKLKNAFNEANPLTTKGLKALLKAEFQFPNASDLQREVEKTLSAVKGIKYKGKGGMIEIGAYDLMGAKKAYNQYDKRNASAQLIGEEAKNYEKLRKAMEAVKNLTESKSRYDMELLRTEAARVSGRVRAAGRKAEREEFADEKAQRKEDNLYRRRYVAMSAEQIKETAERERISKRMQREAFNWADIKDVRSKIGEANKSGDLKTEIELQKELNRLLNARSNMMRANGNLIGAENFRNEAKKATDRKKELQAFVEDLNTESKERAKAQKEQEKANRAAQRQREQRDTFDRNQSVRKKRRDETADLNEKIKLTNALAQAEEARYAKTGSNGNLLKANKYRQELKALQDEKQLTKDIAKEAADNAKAEEQRQKNEEEFNKQVWKDSVKRRQEAARQKEREKKEEERKAKANERQQAKYNALQANNKEIQAERSRRRFIDPDNTEELIASNKRLNALYRERKKLANSAGTDASRIKKRIADINQETEAIRKAVAEQKKMTAEQKKLEKAAVSHNTALNNQSNILSRLGNLAMRYLGIYQMINFAKKLAEMTGFFQRQQVALEGIIGSASEANKLLNEIKAYSLKSPFEAKELIQFTKQLAAFNVDKDSLFDTVKMLGDMSAGLGVSMDRLILAYGQVKSATVLRGQELRQFTEAGVPMVEKLAEKFSDLEGRVVHTSEIFDLISKRKVPFEMVDQVLRDMTAEGGKFYKMQENVSQTVYGQMQKTRDLWNQELDAIGRSSQGTIMGVIRLIQDAIRKLPAILKGIKVGGTIMLITKGIQAMGTTLATIPARIRTGVYEFRSMGAQITMINQKIKQQQMYLNMTKDATKRQNRQLEIQGLVMERNNMRMQRFTMVMSTISAVMSIVSLAIGAMAMKAQEAALTYNQLSDAIAEVERTADVDKSKTIKGYTNLVNTLKTAIEFSDEYNDALKTLQANYNDYVTDGMVKRLMEENKEVHSLAEAYELLTQRVKDSVEAHYEYERLNGRSETAKSQLPGMVTKDLVENMILETTVGDSGPMARMMYKLGSWVDFSGAQNKQLSDLTREIQNAVSEFVNTGESNGYSKDYLLSVLRDYGANDKQAEIIADKLFNDKAFTLAIDTINDSNEKLGSTLRKQLMNNVSATTEEMVSSLRKFEEDNKDKYESNPELYDPFNEMQMRISAMINATNSTLSSFEGLKDEQYKSYIKDLMDYNILSKDELMNPSQTMNEYIELLNRLNDVVSDPLTRDGLNAIIDRFNKIAGLSGMSEKVYGNGVKLFGEGSTGFSKEDKDYAAKWLNRLYTTGLEDARQALVKEYQELDKQLKTYRNQDADIYKAHTQELKEQMKVMERLSLEDLFNVDLSKKESGTTINSELDELSKRLKDAYETYKTAVQSQGFDMGLAYMRNDPKMQERFANFFNGGAKVNGHDVFLDEKGKEIRVGENGKTLREILKDKFIESGRETGVIDFEKSYRAIAAAAKDYYHADEKHRKAFLQLAKSWEAAADAISKDNVKAWVDETNRAFKELGDTFSQISKKVEAYRSLIKNGTDENLGKYIGMSYNGALVPDSVRQKGNIQSRADLYNELLAKTMAQRYISDGSFENMSDALAFVKKSQPYNDSKIEIGNLDSLADVLNESQRISRLTKVNNDNFGAGEYGEAGKLLADDINKYGEAMLKELQSISAEIFTGNKLNDVVANSIRKVETARKLMESQEAVNSLYGGDAGAARKAYIDSAGANAEEMFKQFLASNDFEAMSQAFGYYNANGMTNGADAINMELMKKKFQDIIDKVPDDILKKELQKKFEDLELKILEFNSKTGVFGSIGKNIDMYKNADQTALDKWTQQSRERDSIKVEKTFNETRRDRLQEDIASGNLTGQELENAKAQLVEINADIEQQNINLAEAEHQLELLGEKGELYAQTLRKAALVNIQANVQTAQKSLNAMKDAVTGVINAFKSFSQTINKVYDVMHDGENPDWMKDMDGFLNDFGEAFEALIAPITAVIALVSALATAATILDIAFTPLLIIMAAIIATAAIIAGIIAAIQQHDRNLEHKIEDLKKKVEELDNALKDIDFEASMKAGEEAAKKTSEKLALMIEQEKKLAEIRDAEDAKKNTDTDKLDEYDRAYIEKHQDRLKLIDEIREAITGTADDIASKLSDAFVEAFKNGENAARAWRSTVKEMIGEMLKDLLITKWLAPQIQDELFKYSYGLTDEEAKKQGFGGGAREYANAEADRLGKDLYTYMKDLMSDPLRAQDFDKGLNDIETLTQDWFDSLPQVLRDYIGYNSDRSTISGGIEGVSEDTARTIEGLSNSMLAQLVMQTNYLGLLSGSGIAQVQLSWFSTIQNAMSRIATATESIETMMSDSYDAPSRGMRVSVE